jgi:hypothetical protein
MALNFPSSPVLNQVFADGDRTWIWNGSAWISGADPVARADITLSNVDPATGRASLGAAAVGLDNAEALDVLSPGSVWVCPFFQTASESLSLAFSPNGTTWMPLALSVYGGVNNNLRDPSLLFRNGWWYLTYSPNSFGASTVLYVARSRNLVTGWATFATIDFSSVGGGANLRIWSPDFFEDDDGSVRIVVACNTVYTTDIEAFSIYQTVATATDLSTWSAPSLVFNEHRAIDPFLVKDAGTYYLFYKNEAAGQKWVEVASSGTVAGPYARIRAGNWAGWGAEIEGASVTRRGPNDWIFFADRYAAALGIQAGTSTSLLGTWSSLTSIARDFVNAVSIRHGTPYLVREPGALAGVVATMAAANINGVYGRRLEIVQPGTAAAANTVATFKVNANATNTEANFDFIVDGGTTPLARHINRRVSVANGEMLYAVELWNGSARNTVFSVSGIARRFTLFAPLVHANGAIDLDGNGSPEGVVTAVQGSTYRRRDGGANTSFYVKESGTGNTGWVAK